VASSDIGPSEVSQRIADVADPELPVVSIADLGILRHLEVDEGRHHVVATITPTYSGCPAMEVIADRIVHEAGRAGYTAVVSTQLTPAWTTDWMSERGRARLREAGIAPPAGGHVDCPRCASSNTEELSRFGSAPCRALRRCLECGEPFDVFKAH
jgi:ring-1,2-phenylacetyl-CoA epoxidase subunit PaaD